MKPIWNLAVKRGQDGSKHLDIQMHGYIDDAWDEKGVDTKQAIADLNQHLDAKTIGVRINSLGGSVYGGVALYNALKSHPADVMCCVEGIAASAASIVAMAGKTVMGQGTMMMIHPPSTVAMGNAAELRKNADVLDKVQEALASIYSAKTGKSVDEINDMLDDETWMTAEDAVAAKFADEVMPDVKTDYGPGEQVPAEQNDDAADGDDDGVDDSAPRLSADGVSISWRGATFPVAKLPQQIVAMATKPPPKLVIAPTAAAEPAPITALEPPLTRADLDRRVPELVKALLAEGHATGAAAERTRLQAIDDLDIKGCDDLVVAAKYGDKPSDAPTLAMAVVKAGKMAGAEILAQRRAESKALAGVITNSPDQTGAAEQARVIAAITQGGNSIRGGVK